AARARRPHPGSSDGPRHSPRAECARGEAMPELRNLPSATSGGPPRLRPSSLRGGALSKMGHELRGPLNGIIGLTRIMLMKHAAGPVDAAQQVRKLDMVQTSALRLLAIIERLTDIARIESGGLQPRRETVDCR